MLGAEIAAPEASETPVVLCQRPAVPEPVRRLRQ